MLKKSKSQGTIEEQKVQVFSQIVQMKLKPKSLAGSNLLKKRMEDKSQQPYEEIHDPITMILESQKGSYEDMGKRIKFIASLSSDFFLVGNENQIDMIGYGAIAHGFVDTQYYWSLNLKGPIQSVTVDPKKCLILLLSQKVIYFYRYNTKVRDPPALVTEILIKEGVKFIRILKQTMIGVFYAKAYEIFNIENLNEIKKILDKQYKVGPTLQLLSIPAAYQNIINLFFEEPKEHKQSFILWCVEINFQSSKINAREPYRVHDIMNYMKNRMSVENYNKEIIFVSFGNQIIAVKNGYVIDTMNVSAEDDTPILKYIHPSTLLHISRKQMEIYNFSINMALKPERIVLNSKDSIEIVNRPEGSIYISALKTFKNNFAIFFEDVAKKRLRTNGEVIYYFEVSQYISIKQKINKLFDVNNGEIQKLDPDLLTERCSIARKMGLTDKEIYLQIWNRSKKSSLADFQFILATKDYKTIKLQIQKKLKKASMSFRQIFKIQESCFQMISLKMFSSSCTEETVQEYFTSHFLLRKLKLYRDLNLIDKNESVMKGDMNEDEKGQIKIDIQQYYLFKNLDLKSYFVEHISDMLHNFKNNAKIIRVIIKQFKFIFRSIYKQILEDIIIIARHELVALLSEIPEILPYKHLDLNQSEIREGLYEGIWGQIHSDQWEKPLFLDSTTTIYNKEIIQDVIKSLWYKRYFLTSHDMFHHTQQQIEAINRENNSEATFYFFIAKLFDNPKFNLQNCIQTVYFLQEKYQLFPTHLKGKIILYHKLYQYFAKNKLSKEKLMSFASFLQLTDEHLFKIFFEHQKIQKNCLLKQIKPIYETSDQNGSHIFNIGLFAYFYSDLSAISDLKYILNRINNEKRQFHQKNLGIYQVLVKSMQQKLKIGSSYDIPMKDVLIYIQNIPLGQNESEIIEDLTIMNRIKEEEERFKKIKLNMTIREIIDNCDLVICKVIEYEIKNRKIKQMSEWQIFRSESYKILAEVQTIKEKIYGDELNQNLTLFIYLSKIIQCQSMISMAAKLIEDPDLNQSFSIEEKVIQNLVYYMYKWIFTQHPTYTENQAYLNKLVQLIPEDSICRVYIQNQLHLALLLSHTTGQIQYPIFTESISPVLSEIQDYLNVLPAKQLLSLQIQRLWSIINNLQKIIFNSYEQEDHEVSYTSLHKLCQMYILALLEKELFKEVIPHIYKIFDIDSSNQSLNIVYVMIYIYKTIEEFNQESRRTIIKLFSILYTQPHQLFQILEHSIKTKLTGLEQTKYLREILEQQDTKHLNYHTNNFLFSTYFAAFANKEIHFYNSKLIFDYTRMQIRKDREQFANKYQYQLIFVALCHSPQHFIKFIDCEKQNLNFKFIKYYLKVFSQQVIFDKSKSLEFFKRSFYFQYLSSQNSKLIENILDENMNLMIEQNFQIGKLQNLKGLIKIIYDTSSSFSKKLNQHRKKNSLKAIRDEIQKKNIQKIKQIIEAPKKITQEKNSYSDSDDNKKIEDSNKNSLKNEKIVPIFNQRTERKLIIARSIDFKRFLMSEENLKKKKKEYQDLQQNLLQTEIPRIKNLLTTTENMRNTLMEQLYSHKVVSRSQAGDLIKDRAEDEQFLNQFTPKGNLIFSPNDYSSKNLRNLSVEDQEKQNEQIFHLIEAQEPNEKQTSNYNSISNNLPVAIEIEISQSQEKKHLFLKENLLKTYDELKIPKFDLISLEKEIKKEDQNFLSRFIERTYNSINLLEASHDLKLIEEIGKRHLELGINTFFLQAYQRIFQMQKKYDLELDLINLLPLAGIFIKSKDIADLFAVVVPCITKIINEENIFKVSKLIALGFRKSIFEQEILHQYLKILIKSYLEAAEDETNNLIQKIKSILQKLTIKILIDKGEDTFTYLDYSERKKKLIEIYLQAMKNKGDAKASRQLESRIK